VDNVLNSQLSEDDGGAILEAVSTIMAEPTYKVILFGTCSPHQAAVSQTQSTMQLVTSAVNVKKLGQIYQPKPGLNKRASSYTPVSL
jgi:hypothetical protein